ncbi:PA0069 family radical SAM protein [Cognatishimia sp. SS12]|uniref:PA0069 family radical SAM protein n=1 Tax=Cognatishimia sp. SS12 TaxID=2979465 RepID=UPI0023311506|nr:PA0069 family radical SAM protein [Cognatishimia sp. SS12]MDC0737137.1 PA0069 family radical SAM protein [Cognatishimia sp. SS12]
MSDDLPLPISDDRRRARGAISNTSGRYEGAVRVETHDGWDMAEERALFRTEVREELARSIITRNSSPDISFDRSINPYRGCEHGCIYCFARPTHAYLGYSPGLDFETKLIARPNAAALLDKSLRKHGYAVAPIAIGTNTDPYQPIEKTYKIMRDVLKVLQAFRHPVTIITKGTLIERDIDILSDMARDGLVQVGVSVTSLDLRTSRLMEPRAPSPARRLALIERLSAAGIPVRLMLAPVVPAVTDHEVERILGAGANAGARAASYIVLRLPLEVSELFQEWLGAHFPDRKAKAMAQISDMHGGKPYDPEWGKRMRGEGQYAQLLAHRVKLAMRRLGLSSKLPALRDDLFAVPFEEGDQLSLF